MMAGDRWSARQLSVASLQLDKKNPRLGRETALRAPRELVQYLFDHDKAIEVATSICERGFFPNEPLLVVHEEGRHVVVEGNRRLAALKALLEPGLLTGSVMRQVERLSRRIGSRSAIAMVPVIVAPHRRATDKQVAGRHMGTPVLAWQAENRASFILDKLGEGYDESDLREELGFTPADIQKALQTRAIADMARALPLPPEVKAKLDNPRAKIFTTVERVFDSTVGRSFLRVEPDPKVGLRGATTKKEFVRGFSKLVADVALGRADSRTLNTNDDIRKYFSSWSSRERPASKRGTFVPSDITSGKGGKAWKAKPAAAVGRKTRAEVATVVPRDFRVTIENERLIDIRKELAKLKRKDFPNAGAVLLRVFFELSVVHHLKEKGIMGEIKDRIEKKGGRLPFGIPTLKHLVPEIVRIAKARLTDGESALVEKALRYDPAAPFTISDLHGFVHSTDIPSERDIKQFWGRTEPLFRLMLEASTDEEGA